MHHFITCAQPINRFFPVPLHFCPLSGVHYDIKEEHIIWRPHPSIPCISNHQFWHTQILFTSRQASVSLKQTPWHVLLKGVYKLLPVHSTILDQYGRNSVQTSILYWRAHMKFYLHLLHFYQRWINFSTGDVNKNLLFHKNQPIKRHTSCSDKINFCSYFPHLLPNVRKTQYKLSDNNAIQHWLLS